MPWQKIVIHHSASPASDKKGVLIDVKVIRKWHLARGWHDIGYHFVVLLDGRVEYGRPLNERGAHCAAGNRNAYALGICLVGDFTKNVTPDRQLMGAIGLIKGLQKEYGMTSKDIELHREVPGAYTLCPGPLFPATKFRGLIREGEHK